MRKYYLLLTVLFVFCNPAYASEERQLFSAEIITILSGKTFLGKDSAFEQSFADLTKTPKDSNGVSTTYWEGTNSSFGRWRVTNDEYCSQWPPNDNWTCYQMNEFTKDNQQWVVWISGDGTRFEAFLKP